MKGIAQIDFVRQGLGARVGIIFKYVDDAFFACGSNITSKSTAWMQSFIVKCRLGESDGCAMQTLEAISFEVEANNSHALWIHANYLTVTTKRKNKTF